MNRVCLGTFWGHPIHAEIPDDTDAADRLAMQREFRKKMELIKLIEQNYDTTD